MRRTNGSSGRKRCRERLIVCEILLSLLLWAPLLAAQQSDEASQSEIAVCTFQDGDQMSVRYSRVVADHRDRPAAGKVWMPGGSAITLFTQTEISLNHVSIPTGAYTMYLIPGKKEWTLIVSRNVKVEGAYDAKQDLVRASMQTGTLSEAETELKIQFGHVAPKQCEINVDYDKTRAWVAFSQK